MRRERDHTGREFSGYLQPMPTHLPRECHGGGAAFGKDMADFGEGDDLLRDTDEMQSQDFGKGDVVHRRQADVEDSPLGQFQRGHDFVHEPGQTARTKENP